MSANNNRGFTLLELLIALFIFTIVSMIVMGALHNIINTQSAAEKKSARFAELQIATLTMSRDIEQTIDRSIVKASNAIEGYLGDSEIVAFTRAGLSNPLGKMRRPTLQRVRYQLEKNNLVRITWPELDRTTKAKAIHQVLLTSVTDLHFDYIAQNGSMQKSWPPPNYENPFLPRALRVSIKLKDMGEIQLFYLLPGQSLEHS